MKYNKGEYLALLVSMLISLAIACESETKTADAATDGVSANAGNGSVANDEFAAYKDPGKGPWEVGTPEYCKIDPTLIKSLPPCILSFAVFRYGKLCYIQGDETARDITVSTITLGAAMVGRAAYLTQDIQRTGPGTGPIMHSDLGTDWIAEPTYPNLDASINHIMAFVAYASPNLSDSDLEFQYRYDGGAEINGLIPATEKCISQIPSLPHDAESFVQQEIFDRMGMNSSSWKRKYEAGEMAELFKIDLAQLGITEEAFEEFVQLEYGIVSGWKASVSDMGKFGTLLLHEGWYGNERLLSPEWVYRISHPAFESANTAFGQLAWLNHRGNAVGLIEGMPSWLLRGDPCSPAAFWPRYPHPPSEAQDCRATIPGSSCTQEHDDGIYFAGGTLDFGGGFILMHPGLDLVLVSHVAVVESLVEFEVWDMWDAVRPGLVAMDTNYRGDEAAFCQDYSTGNYAPDLMGPRFKP